ncbi:MAG: (2Fe-2S)-binding protein [Deltaproteobacteria bacterium]|nr:(2Fe-2S)-binding protein [Deltaproteobacteria bacterium]MBN2670494.1 (2Fe-2S)-binding protein [Deltaproteobacteria bacterium]
MSDKIKFSIDDVEIEGEVGQTIMEAADAAGVYIPRLCASKNLTPHGSCRVCTVKVNGRSQAACTQPIAPGIIVENDTDELKGHRRSIVEMLFVEGNHYCMFCEKSGNCELQAVAYRLGIAAPAHEYLFPNRDVDATHPEIFIDRNRCILCGRCVRASKELDNKNVFQFVGRGIEKKVAVNADANLSDTDMAGVDMAASSCPVGAILRKRVGFAIPVGERLYDAKPIGSEIESNRAENK